MSVFFIYLMKIGLPQAFIYYKHPGLWEDFFRALGAAVVRSGPTTRDVLEAGVRITESESCLPVKVYYGHCQKLLAEKIDVLFSPRYISLKKNRLGCPKFFALADVIPYMFKTKVKICAPYINLSEKDLVATMTGIGEKLGFNEEKSWAAADLARWQEERRRCEKQQRFERVIHSDGPVVLLISHPYNLYDRFVNADLVRQLQGLGAVPLMIDDIPVRRHHKQDFFFHWDFAEEMLDQVDEVIDRGIAGGLQVSTFNCGCDSVLKEFVEKKFKLARRPYMPLILDEHTAEAGIRTRLEAFVDTLKSANSKTKSISGFDSYSGFKS